MSIQWGYSQFAPKTDQKAALNQILDSARARGLTFLTDQDARPPGSASPVAHLWDNGHNAVDELNVVMQVRAQALQHFGPDNIPPGTPMAMLEDTLVPVYLYHRYQVEAATKVIGGLQYSYALRGDGQVPTAPLRPRSSVAPSQPCWPPFRRGSRHSRSHPAADPAAPGRIQPHSRIV